MRRSSGITMPVVMAILALAISSMFIGISADMILEPENYIREKSVFLVSERVSSATYAMSSMKEAEMELELEASYTIEQKQQDDLAYIRFDENRDAIEPGVPYDPETGNTTKICIRKDEGSNPRLLPEGC